MSRGAGPMARVPGRSVADAKDGDLAGAVVGAGSVSRSASQGGSLAPGSGVGGKRGVTEQQPRATSVAQVRQAAAHQEKDLRSAGEAGSVLALGRAARSLQEELDRRERALSARERDLAAREAAVAEQEKRLLNAFS